MSDVSASVLFCDDVRQELGGKMSVMGLYRGYIGIADDVPYLPKLVVLVMLDYARDLQGAATSIRLTDQSTVLAAVEFELGAAPPLAQGAAALGAPDRVYANIPVELVGFQAKHGSQLVVQLAVADFQFTSDPLFVVRQSPDDLASAAG